MSISAGDVKIINKLNGKALKVKLGDKLYELQEAIEDLQDLEEVIELGTLVATVGNAESGLVKDVADNAADITALQATVGDAESGLVKDVADNAADITALQATVKASGTYTAIADDATAEAVTIDTEIDAATGFIVQVYRSGVLQSDADVSMASGVITVANNSTDYEVTAGDVVNYIIF